MAALEEAGEGEGAEGGRGEETESGVDANACENGWRFGLVS